MISDVVLGIVLRLKDEASNQLEGFTQKIEGNRRMMRQASSAAIFFGGALMGIALLAAKATDTTGAMAGAFGKTQAELGKLMATLGQGVIPLVVIFLNVITGLLKIINLIPDPILRTAGGIFLMGGAMLVAFGTVLKFITMITELRKALIALGIAQAIVKAVSGPIGWAQLGVGLGIAAGATGAIVGLSKLGAAQSGGQTVNINSQAFVGNKVEARKFASNIQTYQREGSRVGR